MGKNITTKVANKQAYQERKKKEDLKRIAGYLSPEERTVLYSGER